MKRGYRGKIEQSEGEDSPEALSREARRDAKKSIANRTGPPQVDVIKKFSAAATLYEQQGEKGDAISVLNEAKEYLGRQGRGSGDSELRERINKRLNDLGYPGQRRHRGFAYLAIVSFLGALIFISLNLTGHVVENSTSQNFTFAGMGFFMVGLVFVFLYFKKKK
jgi:LPXTG-motif cell wall-anchored protein